MKDLKQISSEEESNDEEEQLRREIEERNKRMLEIKMKHEQSKELLLS
jgi:hypothetical protein